MSSISAGELASRFRDQYGVVSRSQLHALGISARVVRHRLATGEWEAVGPKVVRLSASNRTPEQALFGAYLAAGPAAIASHRSAAWLWHIGNTPARPAITVPRSLSDRILGGWDQ
jgi:hypothetical protein